MAVHQAPAPERSEQASGRVLVYVVEYEADEDEWLPAGWFRAFREAMLVASAFDRARVRLVEL